MKAVASGAGADRLRWLYSGPSLRSEQKMKEAPHCTEEGRDSQTRDRYLLSLGRKQRASKPPLSYSLWFLTEGCQYLEVFLPGKLTGTKAG